MLNLKGDVCDKFGSCLLIFNIDGALTPAASTGLKIPFSKNSLMFAICSNEDADGERRMMPSRLRFFLGAVNGIAGDGTAD